MRIKKALKLLDEWKYRVGLQSWAIKIHVDVPFDEMPVPAIGYVSFLAESSSACIYIVSKKDYKAQGFMFEFDFEKTLVHELLHAKMWAQEPLDKDSIEYIQFHQTLDDLARALVAAKRGQFEPRVIREA